MVNAAAETTFSYNQARAEGGHEKKHCPKREKSQPNHERRKKSSSSSVAYVQILGTGMDTHDTVPSIMLFFDSLRIIFNAGEGLQRFCAEHKIKLSKVDYVCLSRVCSETVGGLPGLLLTLAGIGDGVSVTLKGPLDLDLFVDAIKSFIPHAAISASCFESASCTAGCPPSETLYDVCEDQAVKISAILLQPSSGEDSNVKVTDTSVVYICQLSEIKGKFDRKKAEALGITVRRKFGQLQRGEPVKSDVQDIMVHPSDVMDPSIPGPIVIIVDCPTERHAEKLFVTKSLSCYFSDFSGEMLPEKKVVSCVVHLTPASVANAPDYQNWMKKFGSAQHIMVGHSTKYMQVPILKSSARITKCLNYLCPQLFPPSLGSVYTSEEPVYKFCDAIDAENLLKFTLVPYARLGVDKSAVPSLLNPSQVIDELLSEIPEVTEASQHIAQFWCKPADVRVETSPARDSRGLSLEYDSLPGCLENLCRDDLEVVLLGTGSSHPSKYRNVSSIYINLFSKGSLLLDCGEGTLAQLRRRYGIEGAANAVRNLRCIWISHIHADHHAGITRILTLRRDLLKGIPHEPLHVVGPKPLQRFLNAYNDLEDLNMQFLDCGSTTAAAWDAFECDDTMLTNCQIFSSEPMKTNPINNDIMGPTDSTSFLRKSTPESCSKRQKLNSPAAHSVNSTLLSLKGVLREAGLEGLISFPVVHCPEAFGIILKASERLNNVGNLIPGWKVVYSGDTRPCLEVIKASRGATLLIHEATFEDDLAGEAEKRNHSTTKEAIEVGDSAGVYRIILTHFSQRYPKIPAIDDISSQKACIAFDLMSVNLADLPVLPRVLPYLKLLFKDDASEMFEDGTDISNHTADI